jgi:hypothetical protein
VVQLRHAHIITPVAREAKDVAPVREQNPGSRPARVAATTSALGARR